MTVLSKNVCLKCMSSRGMSQVTCETLWKRSMVVCPVEDRGSKMIIVATTSCHEKCGHKAEHMLCEDRP